MSSLSAKIARFVDANPMKVYGIIFVSGDLFYMGNILSGASFLWALGALCGIIGHGGNLAFGKGGLPQVRGEDFRIAAKDLGPFLKEVILYSLKIFTLSYWRDVFLACGQVSFDFVGDRLRRSFLFWRYPLDFGWIMIGAAGLLYFIDAANFFSLREQVSFPDIMIGLQICLAAVMAFVTDRNDLAGSLFASVTFWTFASGFVSMNMTMILAGCVFLYGNYLIGKVDSRYQSAHAAGQMPD